MPYRPPVSVRKSMAARLCPDPRPVTAAMVLSVPGVVLLKSTSVPVEVTPTRVVSTHRSSSGSRHGTTDRPGRAWRRVLAGRPSGKRRATHSSHGCLLMMRFLGEFVHSGPNDPATGDHGCTKSQTPFWYLFFVRNTAERQRRDYAAGQRMSNKYVKWESWKKVTCQLRLLGSGVFSAVGRCAILPLIAHSPLTRRSHENASLDGP